MTIDLTLDDIMIPALPFFTPTFGTKKAEGGLTTEEVNNNILAFFSRRRPIIIIENSDTTQVEYDANLLLNTAGLTLTLGAGTYVGCTVTVTFPAGGNLQYTSKIGVVTDTLRATASVSYVWKGTWWEAIIGKCAVDDVLIQMPDVPNPGLMYGGQWVEHPYAGMFLRSQGGNAKAFTPPIPGSFTSETVFAATSAIPSSVAVGDLVIAGNEYRTITAISGQNITVDSAFSNRSNITNLLIGSRGALPNITGGISTIIQGLVFLPTDVGQGALSGPRASNVLSNMSVSGTSTTYTGVSLNAANTPGTGKGIYKEGSLPEAVSITGRCWLRNA